MLLIVGTEGAIGRKTAFFIMNTKKIQPGFGCIFWCNALFLPYHHVRAHFFEQG